MQVRRVENPDMEPQNLRSSDLPAQTLRLLAQTISSATMRSNTGKNEKRELGVRAVVQTESHLIQMIEIRITGGT